MNILTGRSSPIALADLEPFHWQVRGEDSPQHVGMSVLANAPLVLVEIRFDAGDLDAGMRLVGLINMNQGAGEGF